MPKPRKCKAKGCGKPFTPSKPLQSVCGPICAAKLATGRREAKASKEAAQDKRETRAKLEALKTFPALLKEVREAMHEWVRLRDRIAGHACISCGRPLQWGAIGGKVDAGHYRSVGSAPHLRFDPRNIHAQCVYCNRDRAGERDGYRVGLIARIGLDTVLELESDQTPRNYTRDDLRELRSRYRAQCGPLRKIAGG